jgi:phage terminase large subunit-like protein
MKPVSPITFIDKLIKKNELGQPFALMDHQREILRLAFAFDQDGKLPWDTLIFSCVKKSGKTTLNGALTLAWGFTQEAPNELLVLANDLEQAKARVFRTMEGLIQRNVELQREAEVQAKQIFLANGSTITAISSDYAGASGSNHGLTSWDELWAYASENSRRLYEELTTVPTRKNSIRLITSYSGFAGESQLLWELYKQGVSRDEHPEGQGERLHPTLPIYGNREARIFCYWDHEPRMPWQTQGYYQTQRKNLRPTTYLRLHENRWTSGEAAFITPELWDPCVVPGRAPTATGRVEQIVCDPYQLHRTVTTLKAAGIPIDEFPQTTANCTRMGQTLFDLLNGQNLRLYRAPDLREQALNTVAIENPRGWRIAKEKASRKIDAIVALAMACCAAIERGKGPGLFIGVDAGIKHDTAAVVAVQWDKNTDKLGLVSHRIWKPTPENPLDIEATIEWYLRQLFTHGVAEIRNGAGQGETLSKFDPRFYDDPRVG